MSHLIHNMNTKEVILIGAREDGHAGVVLDLLESLPEYKVVGFLDNTPELQGTKIKNIPIIGSSDSLADADFPTQYFHICIGDNIARYTLYQLLCKRKFNVLTFIHPSAIVSKHANIGDGCFIGPRSVINNACNIGDASIINTGSIIEHDNTIGYAVHMGPGSKTAGRVVIDNFAFVGIGATVLPDISIGSGAMIGAGAVVVKNIEPQTTIIDFERSASYARNIYTEVEPDVSFYKQEKIYVAQPTLPDYPLLDLKFKKIADSLMLSNFSRYSTQLEEIVQKDLRVEKAYTFPNCTTALMLAIKAMDFNGGEIILPSFTFCATGHAVIWNNMTPVFADIDPQSFNIDPCDVERKITSKTKAILAVHIFGNPVNISALEKLAHKYNLKLLFDSAHALGSQYYSKPIGSFGDAECFSLSGTKVVTSAEGGIITSNNSSFMEKIKLGRNYGAGDDYDCDYIGLNGKMSEFHAAIAIESFTMLETFVVKRNELAMLYRLRLGEIPGISFQSVSVDCLSTYKDFAIIIDKERFGIDRDQLIRQLNKENIFPKKYFYPPLHQMKAYKKIAHKAENLTHTNHIVKNIICLPIYSHMSCDTLEKICFSIYRIYNKTNKGRL